MPVRHEHTVGAGFGDGVEQRRPVGVIGQDEPAIESALAADAANAGTVVLEGATGDPALKVTDGNDATAEALVNTGTIRSQGRDGANSYLVGKDRFGRRCS